jgi:hypothetical protein
LTFISWKLDSEHGSVRHSFPACATKQTWYR